MNEANFTVPSATLTEKPEGYQIKVILPGIAREEADLSLHGRTLTLKTRAPLSAPAGFKPAVTEFSRSNYVLNAELPETADPATLTAKLEHGVLVVRVAKKVQAEAKRIEIA